MQGEVLGKLIKMAKNIKDAKKHRENQVILFRGACDDLEDEVNSPGDGNSRRLKTKVKLVESAYLNCVDAQAEVVVLEKTSSADEGNKTWVKTNLRAPYKLVMDKAVELLETLGAGEDPEAEAKVQIKEARRDAKCELVSFEAGITAKIEGQASAISETNIWLVNNHAALTVDVNRVHEDLTKQHLTMGKNYMRLLEENDVDTEVDRQEKFRSENLPKLVKLQAKLLSKTPTGVVPVVQQHAAVGGGHVQKEAKYAAPARTKFKMAAMPYPKFSGKIVDYPEWKKIFKECVESQCEDSAAVMILRTQSLPDSLSSMVPRCTSLAAVWEKLDKQYLDPTRVWKGVKADLNSLDRGKLGDSKYMMALVNKILDAESLLESVNMVHWLRQEDKIPQYEDLLSKSEKLEWVRLKPKLAGTPWENFKTFLLKMRDEYEEISKTGTVELEEEKDKDKEKDKGIKCDYCKRRGHTESGCWKKQSVGEKDTERKRKCWKCGAEDHVSRDCKKKADHSNNMVKDGKAKKQDNTDHESFSNYLRSKDCRWCGRTYNSAFSCSGCSKQWPAKTKADHCLAHCSKYSGAPAKER